MYAYCGGIEATDQRRNREAGQPWLMADVMS